MYTKQNNMHTHAGILNSHRDRERKEKTTIKHGVHMGYAWGMGFIWVYALIWATSGVRAWL